MVYNDGDPKFNIEYNFTLNNMVYNNHNPKINQ